MIVNDNDSLWYDLDLLESLLYLGLKFVII
jgi:hypothetical protein